MCYYCFILVTILQDSQAIVRLFLRTNLTQEYEVYHSCFLIRMPYGNIIINLYFYLCVTRIQIMGSYTWNRYVSKILNISILSHVIVRNYDDKVTMWCIFKNVCFRNGNQIIVVYNWQCINATFPPYICIYIYIYIKLIFNKDFPYIVVSIS